jgi:hypothetical protein
MFLSRESIIIFSITAHNFLEDCSQNAQGVCELEAKISNMIGLK